MLGRRFLLLVAVLMGLTALAASIAPREPLVRDRRAATPTPTPTAEASAAPAGTVRSVEKTITATVRPVRVTVREGTLLRLTVDSPELDTVSLMDEFQPVEADSPAIFELFPDKPGSYAIMLTDAHRRIGTLVVRAAD